MDSLNLLNTKELNEEIETMFLSEKKRLIIVSPFVDPEIDARLIDLLSVSPAEITFFVRTPESDSDAIKLDTVSNKLLNVKFIEIEYLHAKAYISKTFFIVTSSNFTKHSLHRNFELGILFGKKEYLEFYAKLIDELERALRKNGHDTEILKNDKIYQEFLTIDEYNARNLYPKKVYNMKYLYRDILQKNGRNWLYEQDEDDPEDTLYKHICDEMWKKYPSEFKDGDLYRTALYCTAKHLLPEKCTYTALRI